MCGRRETWIRHQNGRRETEPHPTSKSAARTLPSPGFAGEGLGVRESAAISAYFGYIGIASWGCFGVIRTSPWTITLLVFSVPLARRASEGNREFTLARASDSHAMIPLTAVAILTSLTAIGSFVYGSPAAALVKLRGESLTVEPTYVDFGDGKPGDVLERTITVYN